MGLRVWTSYCLKLRSLMLGLLLWTRGTMLLRAGSNLGDIDIDIDIDDRIHAPFATNSNPNPSSNTGTIKRYIVDEQAIAAQRLRAIANHAIPKFHRSNDDVCSRSWSTAASGTDTDVPDPCFRACRHGCAGQEGQACCWACQYNCKPGIL